MTVDPRNISFKVGSDPIFQLTFNPKNAPLRLMESGKSLTLWDGVQSFQHLGIIFEIDLIWTDPVFFDETQYEVLKALFKERTSFYVYPNRSAEPDLRFLVNWVGNFDFEPATGWQDGWGYFGTMNLVGAVKLDYDDASLDPWELNEYT